MLVRGKRISVLATGPSKNARLFLYCMLLLSIKKKFYVLLKIYMLAVILFVTWSLFIVFSAQHCLLHLHSPGSRKMIPTLYPLESARRYFCHHDWEGGLLLASRLLLNILQHTGRSPQLRIIRPQMSTVSRLETSGIKEVCFICNDLFCSSLNDSCTSFSPAEANCFLSAQ